MFKSNRNLIVVAIIAVVNALGYGIIIPILYTYSRKFGLSDFQNGLLFASYSFCQFLSAPIIGRLSDRFGRRPLLLVSLAGTAGSFLMMAAAPSAVFLFLARMLDGATAGNIPVVAAVISDTTEMKDRARAFGIIGASFGFGFTFGPAITGLTVGFGLATPFLVAAGVSVLAVILTAIILPETNQHMGEVAASKIWDFGKLIGSAFDPNIGLTLLLSMVYSGAFSLFTYAFQPFAVKAVGMGVSQISIIFTALGVIGIISQTFIIPRVVGRLGEKMTLSAVLVWVTLVFLAMAQANSFLFLIIMVVAFGLGNGFIGPIVQALLSREVDAKSQGSIQGLNASYVSVGMIAGPIVGGALALNFIALPFLAGSVVVFGCFLMSLLILRRARVVSEF